jgi:hypothetical protein
VGNYVICGVALVVFEGDKRDEKSGGRLQRSRALLETVIRRHSPRKR